MSEIRLYLGIFDKPAEVSCRSILFGLASKNLMLDLMELSHIISEGKSDDFFFLMLILTPLGPAEEIGYNGWQRLCFWRGGLQL